MIGRTQSSNSDHKIYELKSIYDTVFCELYMDNVWIRITHLKNWWQLVSGQGMIGILGQTQKGYTDPRLCESAYSYCSTVCEFKMDFWESQKFMLISIWPRFDRNVPQNFEYSHPPIWLLATFQLLVLTWFFGQVKSPEIFAIFTIPLIVFTGVTIPKISTVPHSQFDYL